MSIKHKLLLPVFFLSYITHAQINVTAAQVADTSTAPHKEKKKPPFTINGSVDAYYKFAFNQNAAKNLTSFTQHHNQISLGMASIKVEYKGKKIGAVADLGYGTRAKEFSYNDTNWLKYVKQLYISYSPAAGLTVTAGTWISHIGYEVTDPQTNRNYSVGYLFTYDPFSHTGIKAEFAKGNQTFMIGIARAFDFRVIPKNTLSKPSFIAQYTLAPNDKTKMYLNYGSSTNPDTSKNILFDVLVTSALNKKFNLVFNITTNTTQFWDGIKYEEAKVWWGAGLYLNYDPKPWLGFCLRTEVFKDKNQTTAFADAETGGSIFQNTFSALFKAKKFIIIPEFRIDDASEKNLFTTKKGQYTYAEGNFILGLIYAF
jgi:Putative beta-barrel porin-2, OmpL-like. bbp2